MVLALLMAGLFSVPPDGKDSPKPSARVALQASVNGQVRLIGPNFEGYADQILTLEDGRGWELVGTEQRPAKFALWRGKPNAQEWVSGTRIIYSPDRIVVHGSGVIHIQNRVK